MSRTQRLLKLGLVILYGLVFIEEFSYGILSVFAICIHEFFHVLFLRLNSINMKKFRVSILGFRIDLSDRDIISKQITMYSVGSLANLVLGFILILVRNISGTNIFNDFILVNFVIGLFNLIPIFPLDGAFILKSILFRFLKQYTAMFVSILVSVFLSLIGIIIILRLFFVFSVFNFTHLIVIVFSFISVYKEYRILMSTFVVSRVDRLKYTLLKRGYLTSNVISVHQDLFVLDALKLCKFKGFFIIYFVNDNLEIVGVMNQYNILQCYKIFGNIKIKDYYKSK